MPVNYGSGFRGAATGAAAGSMFGPIGTGIGAGVGLISGLLSKSDEDLRRERIEGLLRAIEENRRKRIEDVRLAKAGAKQNAAFTAARLAKSTGREADIQSNLIPAEAEVLREGNEAERRVNAYFDEQKFAVEQDKASEPLPLQPIDYFESLAGIASKYAQGQGMLTGLERELAVREAKATPDIVDDANLGIPISQNVVVPPYTGPVYEPGMQVDPRSLGINYGINQLQRRMGQYGYKTIRKPRIQQPGKQLRRILLWQPNE